MLDQINPGMNLLIMIERIDDVRYEKGAYQLGESTVWTNTKKVN